MHAISRKKKFLNKKRETAKNFFVKIFLLSALLVLVFVFFSRGKFWDGKQKISIAINTKAGDVLVSTFDPVSSEIVTLKIPKDLEVKSSRSLGILKIKGLWKLGENEKLNGKLLSETLTYQLKMPVSVWADIPASGFLASNDPKALFYAVFSRYKTNMTFQDRIKIALFSLGVKNSSKTFIDLADYSFLLSQKLTDGALGFKIEGARPAKISVVFNDYAVSKISPKLKISDHSGKYGLAEDVGEIAELVGAKVISIVKEKEEDFDCMVLSVNKMIQKKMSQVLSCRWQNKKPEENIDVEIKIGKGFAKRF